MQIKTTLFELTVQSILKQVQVHPERNAVVGIQTASFLQSTAQYYTPVVSNFWTEDNTKPYVLGSCAGTTIYVDPLLIWDDLSMTFVNDIEEYEQS